MISTLAVLCCLWFHISPSTAARGAVPVPLSAASLAALGPLVERRFPLWVELWREHVPSFAVSSFTPAGEGSFTPEYTVAFTPLEDEETRSRLYACSPDGSRCVDPYVLVSFERQDDRIESLFDADQGVALIDMEKGTWTRLLFCGTLCAFHDAAWLDDDALAIVGITHEPKSPEDPCGQSGSCAASATLAIIDLEHRRTRMFRGPGSKTAFGTDEYLARRLSNLGLRPIGP